MEGDQTRIFREKLSQWIASQGFWFQLRHSMQSGGGWSMTFYHLVRICIRCALVILVLAAGFAIYVFQYTKSKSFKDSLNDKIAAAFEVPAVSVGDFSRSGSEFQARVLTMEGTSKTFFNKLEANLIRFNASPLSGVATSWDTSTLRIARLNMVLKSGADGPEESKSIAESIMKDYPHFSFPGLDVDDTNFVWGYTSAERKGRGFSTQGMIENSRLKATRSSGGWTLEFTGGLFSQSWLRRAEIEKLSAELTVNGVRISEAILKLGGGTIKLSDIGVTLGEKPQVTGRMTLSRVDLSSILPDQVQERVEGVISGDFRLSGSTNTAEAIVAEGDVQLDGRDLIRLREKVHLLNAMTWIDNYHSYKKVEFNEGSLRLRMSGEKVNISAIDLRAGDLMGLKGELTIRQSNRDEMGETPASEQSVNGTGSGDSGSSSGSPKKGEVSLKEAGKLTSERQGFDSITNAPNPDGSTFNQERMAEVARELFERQSRILRYEGRLQVSLLPDAFDATADLKAKYPVDPASGRILLNIPVKSVIQDISYDFSRSLQAEGVRK